MKVKVLLNDNCLAAFLVMIGINKIILLKFYGSIVDLNNL